MKFISAKLQNIKELSPTNGPDDSKFPHFFKLKYEPCNEVTGEPCTYVDEQVYHNRKIYNQVLKFCERVGTVNLLTGQGRSLTAADSKNGAYARPLIVFECDALLVHEYIFKGGCAAVPDTSDGDGDETVEVKLTKQGFEGGGVKVEQLQGRFVGM